MITGNWGHQERGATEMVNIDCSPLKFFNLSITVESKNYDTVMGFSAFIDVIPIRTDNHNVKERQ